jgi:anti-anti-sigma factor
MNGAVLAFGDSDRDSNTQSASRYRLLGEIAGLASVELHPAKRLDIESTDDFRNMFTRLLEFGVTQFFIDLGEVSYVDSTGISSLIQLHREGKSRGGRAWFYKPTFPVQQLFSLTCLDTVIQLYGTRQEVFTEAEKARR